MIWADQTIQEGLRRGMDNGQINLLLELLQKLPVDVVDCKVADWEKHSLPKLDMSQQKYIRGKINGTLAEVTLADKLGFKNVIITCTPHLGQGLTSTVCTALFTAQRLGMNIGFCIDNASQFSIEELCFLWRDIPIDGIDTFIYGDKESLLDPVAASRILTALLIKIPACLEFHGHNAYGLATGNALAALQVGVKRIAVAVAGIGLQGHAAVEEVIMAQKRLLGDASKETRHLALICSQILSAMGLILPKTKAIIGQDIFAHESGIHVDGVIKNPQMYEAFSPEEVGLTRQLVIGKHSGNASIQAKFRQWNVSMSDNHAQILLKQVRRMAVRQKKQIDDPVLWELYQAIQAKQEG
ncbi:homocitrate synthase/isopropylmalate synthase family protein [Pelosinus propionicus]|uniref:Homocitrate synthase NifV n=1 Tax=Pelosinus propionicus DSM 13327 TaxID=1123291 RepID=A0A1I4J124_9FIRM|nr:pyruvate carboxyltransferase [Pelosinus propionicus]SFL60342.1 homocitrate synthase NifV [Pelosinus propionicus DSM 13327]